jgi:hypothetical protein
MSPDLTTLTREQIGVERWDAFVETCDEAWLWHSWDLIEALRTWRDSFDESFGVATNSGELLAVVPLRRVGIRIARVVNAHDLEGLGGPAFAGDIGRRRRTAVGAALVAYLHELGSQHRVREVRLSLSPLAPAFIGRNRPAVNPLLELGGENVVSQTWIVDLSREVDALWEGMAGRGRTAVRKAESAGVTVRVGAEDDLDAYYEMHCETYARTGQPPHPRAYFEAIWRHFLGRDRATLLIAEHDGAPVAAQSFAVFKAAAAYWTGAASEAGLRLGANNILQWEALKRLRERGAAWYEAGEAFFGGEDAKLRGLSDFKRSTGGQLFPIYRMKFELASRGVRGAIHARDAVRAVRGVDQG